MRDIQSIMKLSKKHQAHFKHFLKHKVMTHVKKALDGGAVGHIMNGEGFKKRHAPLKFRM